MKIYKKGVKFSVEGLMKQLNPVVKEKKAFEKKWLNR